MTQRTAFLGLDKLFKKKPTTETPKPTTTKPDRFSVAMKDVVKGAYFYVRSKEIPTYDVTGRVYPEKVKGQSHVEATGRKKEDEGLVEVLYKRGRVWVRLTDLAKPLQSKFVGARTVTATGGAKDIWERSNNVAELAQVLVETKDAKKFELKMTPKIRKAIIAAIGEVLKSVEGWTVTLDGDTMPVMDGVSDWVGGINQAESFREVRKAIAERAVWGQKFENPETKQRGNTRTADHFLAAAALMALTNKGSTHERGVFFKDVVPQALYRAGGSQLQTAVAKVLRKVIPWVDVEKLRKSRKLKTASAQLREADAAATPETPRTQADVSVLQAYVRPEKMKGPNTQQDLLFEQILRIGPVKCWDLGDLSNPHYMAMILTATPNDKDGVPYFIEKSKQLNTLATLLEEEILRRVKLDDFFHASSAGEKKTLADLYTAAKMGGVRDVQRLMRLCNVSSWYNLVMDDHGKLIQAMKPVRALNALLAVYMMANDESPVLRGQWVNAAVRLMCQDKVLPEHIIAHKMRSAFKWASVRRMLAGRTKLG